MPPKIEIPKAILIDLHLVKELTLQEIANQLGYSYDTVWRRMVEYGIKRYQSHPESSRHPELSDKKWLYQKYIIDEESTSEIATSIGCGVMLVSRALENYAIKKRTGSEAQRCKHHYHELLNKEWLYQKYIIDKMSTPAIANIVGCHSSTVGEALKRYNIPIRDTTEYNKINIPKSTMVELHCNQKLTLVKISSILGYCVQTISKRMKECGIEVVRPSGEDHHNFGKTIYPERKIDIPKDVLLEMCNSGKTLEDMEKHFECSYPVINRKIREYNIDLNIRGDQHGNYGKHGRTHSFEARKKMSATRQGLDLDEWEDFVSYGPYCHKFNNKYKESVREAFGRRCFLCGISEQEQIENQKAAGKRPYKLAVHHTDYNRACGCDGKKCICVPLCISCHGKTHSNRDYWKKKIIGMLDDIYHPVTSVQTQLFPSQQSSLPSL